MSSVTAPCWYCRGHRWHYFCGEPRICSDCPEGAALLEAVARENEEETKRRAKKRAYERRIVANRPRRFDLSLTREQLFAIAAAVERMIEDDDNTAAQRSALLGARRRIEAAVGDAHDRAAVGR